MQPFQVRGGIDGGAVERFPSGRAYLIRRVGPRIQALSHTPRVPGASPANRRA